VVKKAVLNMPIKKSHTQWHLHSVSLDYSKLEH